MGIGKVQTKATSLGCRWPRAGTGSRVTGSTGQWLCPGRVGFRVKVIFVQTRYLDPVSDRTTEWYSVC